MSITPTLEVYVALPNSHIKSPGLLLKETNKVKSTRQQIDLLLKHFQIRATQSLKKAPVQHLQRSSSNFERTGVSILSSETGFSSFRNYPETREKSIEDETSYLLHKAIKIFSLYGIKLMLEIPSEYEQNLNMMLKVLVPELCFFSEKFIKMLKIDMIIVCKEEDVSALLEQYPSTGTFSLPLGPYSSQEDVFKSFYKTILAFLIKLKPKINKDWERIKIGSLESQQEVNNLEDIFISLMHNNTHALIKLQTDKLKCLLIESFSEEFSDDWFKNRNKEKKRPLRVRFSEECQNK